MGEFFSFQIDQDEALEQVVVEDKIDMEVGGFRADPELTANEGEPLAEFEQEVLELADQRGLESFFL